MSKKTKKYLKYGLITASTIALGVLAYLYGGKGVLPLFSKAVGATALVPLTSIVDRDETMPEMDWDSFGEPIVSDSEQSDDSLIREIDAALLRIHDYSEEVASIVSGKSQAAPRKRGNKPDETANPRDRPEMGNITKSDNLS